MSVQLEPIGYFRTSKKYPYEAARQAPFDQSSGEAFIELNSGHNFEQALQGLASFSHLWVIYQFHQNSNWKPIVQPPRGEKQGVFATRSPHRPNPLGLSALKIRKIEGLRIFVAAHDLLDETPIFDLKPYHREADSIPEAGLGWLEGLENQKMQVAFSNHCTEQLKFLEGHGVVELRNFLLQQLEYEPLNSDKKRVFVWQDKAIIAYRTWRALISVLSRQVTVETLFSGYSEADLRADENPHQDKNLHQEFTARYPHQGDLPRFP